MSSENSNQPQFFGRVIDAVLIAAFAALLGAAWTAFLNTSTPALDWFHQASPLGIGLLLAMPPGVLVLGAFLLIRDRYSYRLHYPYRPKRFFRIKRQLVSLEVSDHTIEYVKEKDLEALRDDVQWYEDIYRWTGSAAAQPICDGDGHEVVLDDRFSIWQTYRVKFNKYLQRGQREIVCLRWLIEDRGDAVPFISTTVEENTDILRFRFKPKTGTVSKVYFETKFSISAKRPFETEEITKNGNGEYVKELVPKLYYYYELRWVPLSKAQKKQHANSPNSPS